MGDAGAERPRHVESMQVNDGEAGTRDGRQGLLVGPATAGKRGEEVLATPHPGPDGRGNMLGEDEPPAWPQHPPDLREHAGQITDGTEHEGTHDSVDTGIGEFQVLGAPGEDLGTHTERGGLGPGEITGGCAGLDAEPTNIGPVVLEVAPSTGPQLENDAAKRPQKRRPQRGPRPCGLPDPFLCGHGDSVAALPCPAHRPGGEGGFDFGRWSAGRLGSYSRAVSYHLCGRRLWLATASVAILIAAVVYGDYAAGNRRELLVLDVIVAVVGLALFPLLFRQPMRVGLVLIGLAAFAGAGVPLSNVAVIHIARIRPLPVAIWTAVFGIGVHAVRGLWEPTSGISYGWYLILVIVLHGGLVGWGALAAARAAVITSLRERAERAEAEQGRRVAEARAAERAAIAREMHDVLAHRLSLLATYAGALEYRPDQPAERLSQAAGVIRSTVHQALNELRDVIALLRDEPADDLARPVPALSDLPSLLDESRAIGTPVEFQDSLGAADVPGTTGRTAYRVVQEALTNARKHAPGQPVRIALDGAPGALLTIDVSNPLGGASAIPGSGTGLVGLTERVRLVGGQLDHRATATEFLLSASLPWPA